MKEMNGSIGEVTVSVDVGIEASEQFDAVARTLGYVKERTCTFSKHKGPKDDMPMCSSCGYKAEIEECCYVGCCVLEYDRDYCPNCGARVLEVE